MNHYAEVVVFDDEAGAQMLARLQDEATTAARASWPSGDGSPRSARRGDGR